MNEPGTCVQEPYTAGGAAHGDDLYFISSPAGFCKIGRTRNIEARLSGLQTASPLPLKLELLLPGMGWQETVWHAAFHRERRSGEWFDCSRHLGAAIDAADCGEEWIAVSHDPNARDEQDHHRWRDRIADLEEMALNRSEARAERRLARSTKHGGLDER